MKDTPGAANRTIQLVSHMMNVAEKWGLRPDGSNPCRHVEKFKERKRERYLSAQELARLGEILAQTERTKAERPNGISEGCRVFFQRALSSLSSQPDFSLYRRSGPKPRRSPCLRPGISPSVSGAGARRSMTGSAATAGRLLLRRPRHCSIACPAPF